MKHATVMNNVQKISFSLGLRRQIYQSLFDWLRKYVKNWGQHFSKNVSTPSYQMYFDADKASRKNIMIFEALECCQVLLLN